MPAKNKTASRKAVKPASRTKSLQAVPQPSEELLSPCGTSESLALVDPSMKRALQRRDTEDAVDRLYNTRLKAISKERLASATNKKGEKLRGFLLEAERKRRSSQTRFSTTFWVDIFADFNLLSDWSDALEEPSSKEDYSREFLEKLDVLHSSNPAHRSPKPVSLYLEVCPALNYSELYGLAQAIQVSPVVTPSAYQAVMLSLLTHVARIQTNFDGSFNFKNKMNML